MELLLQAPVDLTQAQFGKDLVGPGKMPAAEESPVDGQGRRMGCLQDEMAIVVDQALLGLGIVAPQQEDEVLPFFRQVPDHRIGELFPPLILVRGRLIGPDSKNGIDQQHPLLCPMGQVAAGRHRNAEVSRDLLENVLERRWFGNTVRNRKTKAMRLPGAMVWILAKDHHLHTVERDLVECIENEVSGGIDGNFLLFFA